LPIAGIDPEMPISAIEFRGSVSSDSYRTMLRRTGPRMRGPRNFAERRERACARRSLATLDKIGTPAPRSAAPAGVLDPARPGIVRTSRLQTQKEGTMIELYDHIQQLRAELRACYMTRRERAAVQAELAKAVADQAELDRAFDRALEALCKNRS
jgi:hypothetical protein